VSAWLDPPAAGIQRGERHTLVSGWKVQRLRSGATQRVLNDGRAS
jgi:hypothetical protein